MGRLSIIDYVVRPHHGGWTVSLAGGPPCGHFASHDEAIRSAVGDAQRVRQLGHIVHVSLCQADGTTRPIPEPVRPEHPAASLWS